MTITEPVLHVYHELGGHGGEGARGKGSALDEGFHLGQDGGGPERDGGVPLNVGGVVLDPQLLAGGDLVRVQGSRAG